MPHELSIVDGKAEMFCAGERPWHGLGVVLPLLVSSFEAIQAAHLEWEVALRPVAAVTKKEDEPGIIVADSMHGMAGEEIASYLDCPDHQATVRTDLNQVLGVVGKRYKPLQNREAFTFFDNVVGAGEAIYESAGALFGGRRVWILAKLREDLVIGGGDRIKPYLLLVNSHDGSQAVRMFYTPVRVVCNNTLTATINRRQVGEGVVIRHTESMNGKIELAQQVLGMAQAEYRSLKNSFNLFYNHKLDLDGAKKYFTAVFELDVEDSKNDRLTSDELVAAFEGGRLDTSAEATPEGSVWRAYNVATHRVDHVLPFRHWSTRSPHSRAEQRMKSVCFGTGATVKARAYQRAIELCGV